MTTGEIGKRLVELCKANKNYDAVEELYATDVVSVEAWEGPGMPRVTKGIDGIRKKHDWWYAEVETHGGDAQGPFVHGDDQFAVIFTMDVTMKKSGHRMTMNEVAVYTIGDGKIVKEQFFNFPMK